MSDVCSSCGAGKAVWRTCSRHACPNALPRTGSFEEALARAVEAIKERNGQELAPVEVRPFPCPNCGDPITPSGPKGRLVHTCRGINAPAPSRSATRPVAITDPLLED